MKRFVFFFIPMMAIVLLASWFASILNAKNSEEAHYAQFILKTGIVKKILTEERFNGERSYMVFTGLNPNERVIIVWLDILTNQYQWVYQDKGKDRHWIEQTFKSLYPDWKILRVTPGWTNGPVWEVLFSDESGRFGYMYFRFYDGTVYSTYRLTPVN